MKKGDIVAVRSDGMQLVVDDPDARTGHMRTATGKNVRGAGAALDGFLKFGYWSTPTPADIDTALHAAIAEAQTKAEAQAVLDRALKYLETHDDPTMREELESLYMLTTAEEA